MQDFFGAYHTYQKRQWILSGIIAGSISLGVGGILFGGGALSADLTKRAGVETIYPADLVLSSQSGSHTITFGAEATRVDSIQMTILSDSSDLSIRPTNPSQSLDIESSMSGVYFVRAHLGDRDLDSGTQILQIDSTTKTPLSLVDTTMMSDGEVYELSNQALSTR